MIIEVHAIQTFGPSNLNRDDTGNPKDALFGGVRRARISSQSAKRAMRVSDIFAGEIQVPLGTRTKTLANVIKARLEQGGVPEGEAIESAEYVVSNVFAKAGKKGSSVLVFISNDEFATLVDAILEARQNDGLPDGKKLQSDFTKRLKDRSLAPDIALFGRMLAENPSLNVDAACEVMHAISTHEVNTAEFDYFTAVDDLTPDEESGAGMLGLIAFNSATYYRLARIHWEQLVANLHGDSELALRTISGFMKSFALVVPSGMKKSFVNQHAPDFLMAVTRSDNDGQSLVNAFEKPVRAKKGSGYAEGSIQELAKYWEHVDKAFRLQKPNLSVLNPRNYELPSEELAGAVVPDLNAWVDGILETLRATNRENV
jgi:CRISPR system Cascade subunit CasC